MTEASFVAVLYILRKGGSMKLRIVRTKLMPDWEQLLLSLSLVVRVCDICAQATGNHSPKERSLLAYNVVDVDSTDAQVNHLSQVDRTLRKRRRSRWAAP